MPQLHGMLEDPLVQEGNHRRVHCQGNIITILILLSGLGVVFIMSQLLCARSWAGQHLMAHELAVILLQRWRGIRAEGRPTLPMTTFALAVRRAGLRAALSLPMVPLEAKSELTTTGLQAAQQLSGQRRTLVVSALPHDLPGMQTSATQALLQTRLLGSSQLEVTEACLGTMTWGVQNSEADAHAQLDYALKERGVTMVDTAELYPVPLTAPAWQAGRTEMYIGSWLRKNPQWRSKFVLATKVCGYMPRSKVAAARKVPPVSPPPDCRLDKQSIRVALEASLERLNTDYIDLYQFHWPDRYVPLFGDTIYRYENERDSVPIEETATAIKELIDEGKIRAYGLSNETPFGVCEWVRVAEKLGMPPPATIQNAYSLLARNFEGELAEACSPRHHNVGLLPWSVLAGGLLTGKYRTSAATPSQPTARFAAFDDYMKRWHPKHAREATLFAADAYAGIAERVQLTPAQLAILWCRTRRFIDHGSIIIGATNLAQLKENLDAFSLPTSLLTTEIVREIDSVHLRSRDPSNGL